MDTNIAPNSTPAIPTKKIGKWHGSYLLVTESFELLKKDKEVMWFPVLAACSNLLIVLICGVIFLLFIWRADPSTLQAIKNSQNAQVQNSVGANILVYACLFVLYLIGAFISAFFQAGLVTIVHGRINGNDLTLRDGVNHAKQNAKKIFMWSLLAATVGIILQFIANRSKWIGRIVAYFLGAAWNIITFFIVPVLVLENLTIKDSVGRSANIFKKTWGETLIMNFSTGLFFSFVFVVALILYIATWFSANMYIIVISSILFVVFTVLLSILSSTLQAIFRVVLYEYAAYDKLSDTFTPELILSAVKKKI